MCREEKSWNFEIEKEGPIRFAVIASLRQIQRGTAQHNGSKGLSRANDALEKFHFHINVTVFMVSITWHTKNIPPKQPFYHMYLVVPCAHGI